MNSDTTKMGEYRTLFIDEAKEVVSKVNNLLLDLEKHPDNIDILNEIFRLMHMLKGSAGAIGATEISELAHKAEDILSAIRDGKITASERVIDLLFEINDTLSVLLVSFEKNSTLSIPPQLLKKINKILNACEAGNQKEQRSTNLNEIAPMILNDDEKRIVINAINKGLSLFRLTLTVKKSPMLSLYFFMLLKKINEHGMFIKSIPSGKDILAGRIPNNEITLIIAHRNKSSLNEVLTEVLQKTDVLSIKNLSNLKIEDLGISKDELRKATIEEDHKISQILSLLEASQPQELPKATLSIRQLDEIKVKVDVLDTLFNLTRELVIIRNRALNAFNISDTVALRDSLTTLDKVVNELSTMIMNIRLVPLDQIFQAFPRLVRDLAKSMNKEVDLILEGGEISIDRTILNELIDPLVSLIRNAIDHGIEPPEERLRKGKPKVGTVKIVAEREGNYIMITVEDDGRGIDVELVKKIAIEKGLITHEVANNLSYKEALMLVTLPGFSTKKNVSQISGRGMGLNAVKTKIEAIGGTFTIWSEKDKGTKVILKVPMSMVTSRVLLIKEGEVKLGIPISLIDFVVKLSEVKTAKYGNVRIMPYKDSVIPVYSLSQLLSLRDEDKYVVIVNHNGRYIGISVSEVIGMEDVVIESIDRSLLKLPWINGVSVLGDGSTCLIIDPFALIPKEAGAT